MRLARLDLIRGCIAGRIRGRVGVGGDCVGWDIVSKARCVWGERVGMNMEWEFVANRV